MLGNGSLPSHRFPSDDVRMSDWAFPAITWANNRGWIQGRADGRFHPGDYVSRQEFAIMLVRAFSTPLHSGSLPFTDNDLIADWALPYVRRAVERGWITGFADGRFGPTLNINRGDAMTMVRRAAGPLRVVYDPYPRRITWDSMLGANVGSWYRIPGYAIGPLPSTNRTNHHFNGWFNITGVRGGTQTMVNTRMPSGGVTYFARWFIWHAVDSSEVRFWRGTVNVFHEIHNYTSANPMHMQFLNGMAVARTTWGNALSVTLNTSTRANANIQSFSGPRATMMDLSGAHHWRATYIGLAFPAAESVLVENINLGGTRTVRRNTGSGNNGAARIFNSSGLPGDPLTAHRTSALVSHEFGHAMGYRGHSPNRGDLMFNGILPGTETRLTLSERERVHLRQFYDRHR